MDNSVIYIMVGGVSRQTTKKDFYDYLLDVYPYQYNPEITQDYDFYDDAEGVISIRILHIILRQLAEQHCHTEAQTGVTQHHDR